MLSAVVGADADAPSWIPVVVVDGLLTAPELSAAPNVSPVVGFTDAIAATGVDEANAPNPVGGWAPPPTRPPAAAGAAEVVPGADVGKDAPKDKPADELVVTGVAPSDNPPVVEAAGLVPYEKPPDGAVAPPSDSPPAGWVADALLAGVLKEYPPPSFRAPAGAADLLINLQ